MTSYWCEQAWLPGGVTKDVLVEVGTDGRVTAVTPGVAVHQDARSLRGLVLPGFANAHSHAFHRALRGRTHADGGSFWTWRQQMYALAAVIEPTTMYELARAAYAEMALAGITCVGEFHYLHHGPDGRPYDDPNVMGDALRAAATDVGVRLTLLDACYLSGGIGQPLSGLQLRFGDGSVEAWAERVGEMTDDATSKVGVAVHSVRAVPAEDLGTLVAAFPDRPLHVHLSEQPAENAACLEAYGCTPTELLHGHGVLGPRTTAVHATHLTDEDVRLLGASRTASCFCPTTERDLADGIGPARRLADAGSPLCLGSDQHAVVDPFEEVRGLETHERLSSLERGRFSPTELLAAATWQGHAALGWAEAGRIAVGAPADLVAVTKDSVRTAGSRPDQILFSATASDVTDVVASGHPVVRDGEHLGLGPVGPMLADVIDALWREVVSR
ncbi:MAG TPA: formimidoylglutamate deiminase [Candidatus Limnocylindria bacterium]|nr:formimidoylglutamate deiminase [Candidatus Limnocylindria bacterium]